METNRRTFIRTSAVLGSGLIWYRTGALSLTGSQGFELPSLGFAFDALEPYIDAQTMQIHHDKHHLAYINKLNEALVSEPSLNGKSLNDMLMHLPDLPEKVRTIVRNHGGGHWNHSFFWKLLRTGTHAQGKLNEAIVRDFGSMENLMTTFEKSALGQFGSGWAWLVSDKGKLLVRSTPNQDNPLMDGVQVPVFGIDVWEHAYYLKYQNRRGDYVKAFWNVLNWDEAEKNYLGSL